MAVRDGWDRHVQFGLDHPAFYVLLYGRIEPGRPCAITGPAHTMLCELLTAAAQHGLLRVPPAQAAGQILAANTGVTLALITQPGNDRDPNLSASVREAAIAGVLRHPAEAATSGRPDHVATATTLRALIQDKPAALTTGEHILLQELLERLAAAER